MSFKDSKEEVLEIELTSYGKKLLSRGDFKPEFYSFFDDDIIYDASYTSDAEEQNYAQTRIIEESPRTRVQVNFEGLETQIKKQIDAVRRGKLTNNESFQNTPEKEYALSAPLGKSELSSDSSPAWDITSYGTKFASKKTMDVSHPLNIKIPQLTVDDVCFYTEILDTQADVPDDETGEEAGDAFPGHAYGVGGYANSYENKHMIEVYENYLIFEVDEFNTPAARDNYDVELFMVEEYNTESGKIKENLLPLMFKKIVSKIQNGIYDEEKYEEQLANRNDETSSDTSLVEHYFYVYVDEEIDTSTLCKLGYRTDFSKRGYIRVDCDDDKPLGGNRMAEVYDPFGDPNGPYGDDC